MNHRDIKMALQYMKLIAVNKVSAVEKIYLNTIKTYIMLKNNLLYK